MVGISPGTDAPRQHVKVWDYSSMSDVDGCFELCNGRALKINEPLSSSAIPTLCLLDMLRSAGWHAVQKKVIHDNLETKFFDTRRASSKRLYFQCVLACSDLFEACLPVECIRANVSKTLKM